MAIHFELEGNLVHKESDEGRRLMAKQAEREDGAGDEKLDSLAKAGKKARKLTNQFNFNERASQTLNNPPRVRGLLLSAICLLPHSHLADGFIKTIERLCRFSAFSVYA